MESISAKKPNNQESNKQSDHLIYIDEETDDVIRKYLLKEEVLDKSKNKEVDPIQETVASKSTPASNKAVESEIVKIREQLQTQNFQESKQQPQEILESKIPREASSEKDIFPIIEKQRNIEKEIPLTLRNEGRVRFNKLLESRGAFDLSKEEFNQYFSSKDFEVGAEMKQGNTGDCYLVAALHAMSVSPHFETIIRSSVKRLPDGTWQVKIPPLSEVFDTITLSQNEINWSFNKKLLRRTGEGFMPELRPVLNPLSGKQGFRVLEAAFIKNKFGTVDRIAAEGGWMSEVFRVFTEGNFRYRSFHSGWNELKQKYEPRGLDSLRGKESEDFDTILENFDPETDIATVATKHFQKGIVSSLRESIFPFYRAKGTIKFFVPGHAYSISKVDQEKREVTLANPWNTKKPILLTFDQFKSTFSSFQTARLDTANMIKNLTRKLSGND